MLAESLHQEGRSQRPGQKNFQLENTFTNGDGIAWQDKKAPAGSLRKTLRIHLENLIAIRIMSSHRDSFRRSDARVSAGHGDRLE